MVVVWCAAFHQRSRALPRSVSSTTNPCCASWRRWYDVAPVLSPSRPASVVAVAGPSMRSRPEHPHPDRVGERLHLVGGGVIEVRSTPSTVRLQSNLCKHFFAIAPRSATAGQPCGRYRPGRVLPAVAAVRRPARRRSVGRAHPTPPAEAALDRMTLRPAGRPALHGRHAGRPGRPAYGGPDPPLARRQRDADRPQPRRGPASRRGSRARCRPRSRRGRPPASVSSSPPTRRAASSGCCRGPASRRSRLRSSRAGCVRPGCVAAAERLGGSSCAEPGVNLNLAPVLDTVPGPRAARRNPPIGAFDRRVRLHARAASPATGSPSCAGWPTAGSRRRSSTSPGSAGCAPTPTPVPA